MTEIFSEENLALHREYLRKLRLRYSILETSVPRLSGASLESVYRLGLTRRDREDVMRLLPEIELHEIFFSSFTDLKYPQSNRIAERFGSVASYLDAIYRSMRDLTHGFLVIYESGDYLAVAEYYRAFRHERPVLAIDMCEHSYFLDYGFDRERYVYACLSRLNIGKITT